jgi:hypothetical protein
VRRRKLAVALDTSAARGYRVGTFGGWALDGHAWRLGAGDGLSDNAIAGHYGSGAGVGGAWDLDRACSGGDCRVVFVGGGSAGGGGFGAGGCGLEADVSRRAALDGLAQGLEMALVSVRRLLEEADPDDWVDQEQSPIGRRRHCELSRTGKFPSARKVNGHWLVRRRELDAFVEGHAMASSSEKSEADEMAEVLAFSAPDRKRRKK